MSNQCKSNEGCYTEALAFNVSYYNKEDVQCACRSPMGTIHEAGILFVEPDKTKSGSLFPASVADLLQTVYTELYGRAQNIANEETWQHFCGKTVVPSTVT